MFISNRFKIILSCTVFNFAFEYSLRGLNVLIAQPFLAILLTMTYFALYTMAEDLIVRYRLRDHQIALFVTIYMMFHMGLVTGVIFKDPSFLGINLANLIFVGILWSGAIQGVITFYFANRIQARDWNHPRLGKIGWALSIAVITFTFALFLLNPHGTRGTILGYTLWATVQLIAIILFLVTIRRAARKEREFTPEKREFNSSPVLDVLAFGSFVLFLVSAVFPPLFLRSDQIVSVAGFVNRTSLRVINIWTLILCAIMLGYRFKKKDSISV